MNPQVWLAGLATAVLLFQLVSIPALLFRKNDLADVLWGPAFPLSAFAAVLWAREGGITGLGARNALLLAMISLWAVRLFLHVGLRNLSHRAEDVRYNNWRKEWGKTWLWRSYLQVFVLQAFILYLFLSPVLLALSLSDSAPGVLCWAGILVWLSGFLLESIADEQLRRFKSKPESKGKLMTTGVWSWSRHPNYFGEVVQWWGIWLMVAELPWGWLTALGPIGVTYLILKVSGVSMLEDLMKNRPGYADYCARTSVFFPRPPAK